MLEADTELVDLAFIRARAHAPAFAEYMEMRTHTPSDEPEYRVTDNSALALSVGPRSGRGVRPGWLGVGSWLAPLNQSR